MDLPSFTIDPTTTFSELLGDVVDSELEAEVMANAAVIFTPNIGVGDFVVWEHQFYRVRPVVAYINGAGGIEREYESGGRGPVLLLANNPDLNVTNIQWTVTVKIGKTVLRVWTFTAPADGVIFDLATVAPVVNAPAKDIARGPRGHTPWYVPVADTTPQLYQAMTPDGPAGDPIPLNTVMMLTELFATIANTMAGQAVAREALRVPSDYDPRLDDPRAPITGSVGKRSLDMVLAAIIALVEGAVTSPYFQALANGNVLNSYNNTNNNQKVAKFGVPHYVNAEEPVYAVRVQSDNGVTLVQIGGGSSTGNAATQIEFYVATDSTTVTGTRVAYFDSAGVLRLLAGMTGLEQKDPTDTSKKLRAGLSTIPASTTRVMMAPVARTSQFSLNNSNTETDVISMPLEAGALTAGATFRIRIAGSVRNAAASGALTFKVYIGPNAAPQSFVGVPNQANSGAYKDIYAEFDVTVRTAGASGTFAAAAAGMCTLSGWNSLGSTVTGTSAVDTTTSPVVKLTAQWANADTLNALLLETATIQQIV